MSKKGSLHKIKKENVIDDDTSSDDKTTKFLTNQILKQQKLKHELNVNNFLKNNGLIILSF